MFSRMLKLPDEVRRRYDLSSLEIAIHAAAPCPVPGQGADDRVVGADRPRVLRRHRGMGFAACDTARVAAHRAPSARWCWANCTSSTRTCNPIAGRCARHHLVQGRRPIRVLQRSRQDRARRRSTDGSMSTVGDVGYVDDDGYLYLTDRAHLHDHLRRRQHLPAGEREPAHHPSQGGRCRGIRRAQRRPRRGGEGGGAADARRAAGARARRAS